MILVRKSRFTGVTRTMDLPITDEQMAAFNAGALVQQAFPQLDKAQREFILTGATQEEWDAMFPPEDQ